MQSACHADSTCAPNGRRWADALTDPARTEPSERFQTANGVVVRRPARDADKLEAAAWQEPKVRTSPLEPDTKKPARGGPWMGGAQQKGARLGVWWVL